MAGNSVLEAKSQGALGEPSHGFLFKDGVYIQAFYNDVLGETDKLLTNGSKFGILSKHDNYNFEFTGSWRFVTPSIQDEFGAPHNRENPPGVFADWMNVNLSVLRPFRITEKSYILLQGGLGFNHFGDKGAGATQRWLHGLLNKDVESYTYEGQIRANDFDLSEELAYAYLYSDELQFRTAFGFNSNYIINSLYFEQYALYNHSEVLKMSLSFKLVRQLSSSARINLENYRIEASYAVIINESYKPAVSYISNYVKGSEVRQIMVDFLSFQI